MTAGVTATCRIALQVRPHSPPYEAYEGGVAVPRRKRIRSEMARPGWSLTSYVAESVLKHGARATPRHPSFKRRGIRSANRSLCSSREKTDQRIIRRGQIHEAQQ